MAKKNNNQLGFDKGRQLFCDQREKTLIAVLNHLKSAPITEWCSIHAQYSRIQLLFQDYSTGKGSDSKYAKVNLTAGEVEWIFHCVAQICPLTPKLAFKERFFKEFSGKYSELIVERVPTMRIQWCMTCTNGDCDDQKKPIKGTETKILQRYTDAQMFQFWKQVDRFVERWENITQAALQKHGAPLTKKALEEEAKRNEANGQQNGNRYGNNAPAKQQQPSNRYGNSSPAPAPSPAPVQPDSPPPPPGVIEDDVPFDEMPSYGSGYSSINQ